MNNKLLLAAILTASALAACTPIPKPPPHHPLTTQPATQSAAAPLLGIQPLSGGIFLPVASTIPLSGDALTRARMTPTQILQSVQSFTAGDLSQAPPTSAPATQPAEPPAEAVKLYLHGRALFLDGNNTDAMDALDQSLKLDPNAFTVLRLMGQVCFAASQLARGSVYLQRAYRLDPTDMQVNYLLGRYWLERKDNDRAIFYLSNADHEKSRGEAQAPLISFYLARAYQSAGYHAAAAATLEDFLTEAALPVAGYRYDRELSYLIDQRWAGELAAAENLMLIGDWKHAVPYYQRAAADQPADSYIASRLVNAQLHASGPKAARDAAYQFLKSSVGSPDAIALFLWTAGPTDHVKLIPEIRAATASLDLYHQAQVIANAYDALHQPDAAFTTLADYLAAHPTDSAALQHLLARNITPQQFPTLLTAAATALKASPDHSDDLLKYFSRVAESDAAALWAHDAAPPIPADPYARFLAAVTLNDNDGDPKLIESSFRAAIDNLPDYFQARQSYITWLIATERYTDAATLIDAAIAAKNGGARAWELRVLLTMAQDRLREALAIAQQGHDAYPDDKQLILRIASIERIRGDYAASDKQYTDLIAADPTYADAYENLIGSYLERVRRPGPANGQAALAQAIALLGRLTSAVPSSLFGQITTATLYGQVGRAEEAETMMARLAADHPEQPEIAIALAHARQANGKASEAAAGLEQALHDHPSSALVSGLAQLYRLQDKSDAALDLVRRYADEHPAVARYAEAANNEFDAQEKPEDAVPILTKALQASPRSQELAFLLARRLADAGRMPDAIATLHNFMTKNGSSIDRLYELSHLYARAGQSDDAELTLREVLRLQPTHTGAANDLGFYYAEAGTHLDDAEKLVKIAIAEEPQNGAYLDSLGWVYYKQGRFADSVEQLQQALGTSEGDSPDVQAHYADALYRSGKTAEAVEAWRQAQSALDSEKGALDHDDAVLKVYLEKVLAAVNANQPPAVTPTAADNPPHAATR